MNKTINKDEKEKKLKKKLRAKLKRIYVKFISLTSFSMGNLITLKRFCDSDEEIKEIEKMIESYKQSLSLAYIKYDKVCKGERLSIDKIKSELRYLEGAIDLMEHLSEIEAFCPYFDAIEQWKVEEDSKEKE